MDFIIVHQLNWMMVLAGICGFIFLFLLSMKISERGKKLSFLQIAFFAMILLLFDRYAYLYRGNETTLGYWMVRISNYLVFASILLCENGFNNYLFSLAKTGGLNRKRVTPLLVGRVLAIVGIVVLTISQFTGFYYTFDATNHYQRADGFLVCYLMPLLITVIQFGFIFKNRRLFGKSILISLFLFEGLPVAASLVQIFHYGLSLTSISIAVSAIVLYFLALYGQNSDLAAAANRELQRAKEIEEQSGELLHQTVEALASAVDAKDNYTHGHSNRVAQYAKEIAKLTGLSDEECRDVYLAGLLHDVGKIGIDDTIINKDGKLTKEEFAVIKQHPILGEQILNKITISPILSVGAHYHHERYDGTGYPEGLKGEDIPRIARIIAVADAYDAMTSKRSYREQIPQQQVREELVKGIGTQFDPEYAKVMLHLLDQDDEYMMKEKVQEDVFGTDLSLSFTEYKSAVSVGLRITDCPTTVRFKYKSTEKGGIPTLLFYDAADARYYIEESKLKKEMDFVDYAAISLDGKITKDYVREVRQNISRRSSEVMRNNEECEAKVRMVKQEDHLLVQIATDECGQEVILALYDASRYLYLALTGERCNLEILDVEIADKPIGEGYVPRIAEKISYIDGPSGDIPNVQVDGWRTAQSQIMEVTGRMEIDFHTMSLPSSRRIWHCPIICIFTSSDGSTTASDYKEVAMVRVDGEVWCEHDDVVNMSAVSKDESFENWNTWKNKNLTGVDCRLSLLHEDNHVTLKVTDSGVTTVNRTVLPESTEKVYCFFTGDQCAITNIRINE